MTKIVIAGTLSPWHCLADTSSVMQSHEISLRDALSDDGDLELRFQCGQSLPVHSQKLKLASAVLKGLITAVLDDLIASSATKRRRIAEGSNGVEELPSVQVSQAKYVHRHAHVAHAPKNPCTDNTATPG